MREDSLPGTKLHEKCFKRLIEIRLLMNTRTKEERKVIFGEFLTFFPLSSVYLSVMLLNLVIII